ncbi:MAG TPA: ribosome assembly cofactor RimP [Parasegetibacter sp.]
MANEVQIDQIKSAVSIVLEEYPDLFLVEVRIKPTNNIKVFIDGDQGVSIDKCVKINRSLYKRIEELGLYTDGDFSLEVSSPGLSEPLKLFRQYTKNVGRDVEIVMTDGTNKEGKLLSVTENELTIETEEGKGKKKQTKQETLQFDQIKSTKIQIKF